MGSSGSFAGKSKIERQKALADVISQNPFITDVELASRLDVSVQTIRLDRLEMGIPEARERIRRLAHEAYSKVKALTAGEVIGQLISVKLGEEGTSILDTTPEMSFTRTRIVRGHHIFAQANSLAVAIVDAEVVLTGSASIRFKKPVYAGDRLIATARVMSKEDGRHRVHVVTRVGNEEVFSGDFVMFTREGL
ncbi:MAG TPA: transcription factor FapR [Firmicutes bacterium]|nr:transcription factor FapR [Bacillota bacterium]HHY98874.1 transcription factor FapR [Bacillota bacterium]